ncbi:MAG: AAA family ATPase [Thermaerobacter sp.]|nr:AAA family ATPase [Thermaerobacter sp.]
MPASVLPSDHSDPLSTREVLHWLESGRLTPDAALRHLARIERHAAPGRPDAPGASPDRIDHILAELNNLVGLAEVKQLVAELRAFIDIQSRRAAVGLRTESQMLHMVFKGAPGTGKTTVARVLGRLLQALDVLPKGHLVEVERADLVGEYIGHTAQKTRDAIKRALGGILFVDEAYALARGGDKDFGKEAIDTLVAALENHRDEFILILAGYPDEMAWLMASNPGLLSRFPIHLTFPDYRPAELVAICRLMLEDRQYHLDAEAQARLTQYLASRAGFWHANAGNARLVRNLLERAIRQQAVRLSPLPNLSRSDLMLLTWADFEGSL